MAAPSAIVISSCRQHRAGVYLTMLTDRERIRPGCLSHPQDRGRHRIRQRTNNFDPESLGRPPRGVDTRCGRGRSWTVEDLAGLRQRVASKGPPKRPAPHRPKPMAANDKWALPSGQALEKLRWKAVGALCGQAACPAAQERSSVCPDLSFRLLQMPLLSLLWCAQDKLNSVAAHVTSPRSRPRRRGRRPARTGSGSQGRMQ